MSHKPLNVLPPMPLIVVAGPTASGKSELAVSIAERFGGEIVNYDSLQLYRYLDIGTAKPSIAERRGVPHHLLDILDPNQVFTAGDFARLARATIGEVASRGRIPVMVGGTGFYLRATLDGLFHGPKRDEALRTRLSERSGERLHRILRRLDPAAAERIHPNDKQKLIRAVEVCLIARRPITEMFAHAEPPLTGAGVLKFGLDPPRDELYERINRRTAEMFSSGLIDEVQAVLRRGFPESSKALEAIGYREALLHLRGELTLESAIATAQQSTRRYAKRQWTWFRREPGIEWLPGTGNQNETKQAAFGHAEKLLKISFKKD